MIKQAALAVVVVAALVVVAGLARGSDWRVERSVVVAAAPAAVLPLLTDFERGWRRWSVWQSMDPAATWRYGGAPGATGHWMQWRGPEAGAGRLTLTVVEGDRVGYQGGAGSDEDRSRGVISVVVDADGSRVTWVEEGRAPPVIGGLVKSALQKMLGEQLQTNLDQLKVVVEQRDEGSDEDGEGDGEAADEGSDDEFPDP
jgi:hypothetical protein